MAQQEQKKRGRAARAAYFTQSVSGEYIYNGPLYRPAAGQKLTWKQAMTRRWVMGAAVVALVALCGCLPLEGMMRTVYVLAPYVGQIIAAGMLLWAVGQMAGGAEGLREYVYASSVQKLPDRAAATAFFAALTAAGESVSLCLDGLGGGNVLTAAAFYLAEAAVLGISLIWRRMERNILWEK